MIIYGKHPVLTLIEKHPDKIKKLHLTTDVKLPDSCKKIPKEYCDNQTLEKLSGDRHHQGIVAVLAEYPYAALEDAMAGAGTLCILDHIEDPGNLGTILRNALIYGIDGVIIPSKRACEITAAAVKASAGTAFDLTVVKVSNINDCIRKLKQDGFWVYGFEAGMKDQLASVTFDRKAVFVLGSEGSGIHALTKKNCDFMLSVEMAKEDISLNVAAASAIIFYSRYMQARETT